MSDTTIPQDSSRVPEAAKDFSSILDADPLPEKIKQNEDGSLFIPISIVQNDMDRIFNHGWGWNFEREIIGKTGAMGKGMISYTHPVTGKEIIKSGTAAINLIGNMKLDYPRLEAMAFLNAAKKIGRCFGRNLNRDIDDAPALISEVEKSPEIDQEFEETKKKLIDIEGKADAEAYLNSTSFKYHTGLKQIISTKK